MKNDKNGAEEKAEKRTFSGKVRDYHNYRNCFTLLRTTFGPLRIRNILSLHWGMVLLWLV